MASDVVGAPRPDPGSRAGAFWVRLARFSDLREVIRLYRNQSPASRLFYHPYPPDRPRLVGIFGWMVLSQHLGRAWVHLAPNFAFALLVVGEGPSSTPIGYGTIRFVFRPGEALWARFGFHVAEGHRGQGIGTLLATRLYQYCLDVGVERGGGTVQRANAPSLRIVERFGFRMGPSHERDRYAPQIESLEGVEDLREVQRRVREWQSQTKGELRT